MAKRQTAEFHLPFWTFRTFQHSCWSLFRCISFYLAVECSHSRTFGNSPCPSNAPSHREYTKSFAVHYFIHFILFLLSVCALCYYSLIIRPFMWFCVLEGAFLLHVLSFTPSFRERGKNTFFWKQLHKMLDGSWTNDKKSSIIACDLPRLTRNLTKSSIWKRRFFLLVFSLFLRSRLAFVSSVLRKRSMRLKNVHLLRLEYGHGYQWYYK